MSSISAMAGVRANSASCRLTGASRATPLRAIKPCGKQFSNAQGLVGARRRVLSRAVAPKGELSTAYSRALACSVCVCAEDDMYAAENLTLRPPLLVTGSFDTYDQRAVDLPLLVDDKMNVLSSYTPPSASYSPGSAATPSSSYSEHKPKTPPPDLPSLLLDSRIVYIGMPVSVHGNNCPQAKSKFVSHPQKTSPRLFLFPQGCSTCISTDQRFTCNPSPPTARPGGDRTYRV